MERNELIDNDKGFYHIVTVIICLGIVLLTSLALLISYVVQLKSDKTLSKEFKQAQNYDQVYFSDKIFTGVTVSGCDVGGMTVEQAKQALINANLKFSIEGAGEKIINQLPKAGVKVNQQSTVMLYTEETMVNTTATVPNLLNMTVNQVATLVSNARLNLNVQGAGSTTSNEAVLSYKQSLEPGTVVDIGTTITVEFKRIEAGE